MSQSNQLRCSIFGAAESGRKTWLHASIRRAANVGHLCLQVGGKATNEDSLVLAQGNVEFQEGKSFGLVELISWASCSLVNRRNESIAPLLWRLTQSRG